LFRDGLKQLINSLPDMEVVGEAENGQEGVALTRVLQPDVILMDVKMPVMDGIEATKRITAENPGMRILGLSMYSGDIINSSMMSAGCVGCLIKGDDFEGMSKIIRQVAGLDES
jgi:DNA-binding NarL/FixJ family response regulator